MGLAGLILSPALVRALRDGGVEALAMEFMPRITRAQSMDILSSQSNLAGYKAVLDAAAEYGRAFPMMMTAAGTVSAAKVFVMSAGATDLDVQCLACTMTRSVRVVPPSSLMTRSADRSRPRSGARVFINHSTFW